MIKPLQIYQTKAYKINCQNTQRRNSYLATSDQTLTPP